MTVKQYCQSHANHSDCTKSRHHDVPLFWPTGADFNEAAGPRAGVFAMRSRAGHASSNAT